MIDLHTHSIFSDGSLIPLELAQRAEFAGYRALAFTDHCDISNYDFIIPRIVRACEQINRTKKVVAIPGAELTHIPPEEIAALAVECRKLGAQIILVHGETLVEPVPEGTNRSAVAADIDILAHPGLITPQEASVAAQRGIYLEITSRTGHSLSNGHVAAVARACGAKLVLNTDCHSPGNLISLQMAHRVAAGAGLSPDEMQAMFDNSRNLCGEKGFHLQG